LKNILLICTGNTCRSVMAKALLEQAAADNDLNEKIEIDSAGTFACEGEEASPEAVAVMDEMDIDIRRHKSKQFTRELGEWADLILTMEARHIEQLKAMAHETADKTHTLIGWGKGISGFPGDFGYDILDPYREPIKKYRECVKQLQSAVKNAVDKLAKE